MITSTNPTAVDINNTPSPRDSNNPSQSSVKLANTRTIISSSQSMTTTMIVKSISNRKSNIRNLQLMPVIRLNAGKDPKEATRIINTKNVKNMTTSRMQLSKLMI